MKIVVTGCAGFIASRVSELLLDNGHEVVGVDDLNDYYDVRLKARRLDALRLRPSFTFLNADVGELAAMQKVFDAHRVESVFNLAARAGVRASIENPYIYFQTNTIGNLNLLELCKTHGVRKYVLASTSSVYAGLPIPFREDVAADTPRSPYAASKKAAELTAYAYHHLYGLDISVVRYFTVYGPAGRPDMSVFKFIVYIDLGKPIPVYGDGSQTRDFTYVDDIARGTICAMKPLGYEIINLGNNRPHRLSHVIELIEKELGKKAQVEHLPAHKADVEATCADISKAERLLGWRPLTSLQDGIHRSVQWYLQNREWVRELVV